MAVLTDDAAVKDDFLRGLGETTDFAVVGSAAEDDEYRRDVREIYEKTHNLLLQKAITAEAFNEVMGKCHNREFAREVAENHRARNHICEYWGGLASKYGITEDDVNEAIMEVREERRAEDE